MIKSRNPYQKFKHNHYKRRYNIFSFCLFEIGIFISIHIDITYKEHISAYMIRESYYEYTGDYEFL